jgi:hypothetical protein
MDKQREADVWGRTSIADKLDRSFAVGAGRYVSDASLQAPTSCWHLKYWIQLGF